MICPQHRCLCYYVGSDLGGDVYECVLGGEALRMTKVAA